VILLSEAFSEAECPSIDALLIPATAPIQVLEALKCLVSDETSRLVNSPEMARAA
jgi:hypothetical protein